MHNESRASTFGYLIVDRHPADRVTFPDGSVELHPFGEGEAVVAEWNARPPENDAPPAGPEVTDAAVDERLSELVRDWERATEAALSEIERDSSGLGNPASRRAAYLRRHPRPTEDDARRALQDSGRGASGVRRRARSEAIEACWWATFESASQTFRLPVYESQGLPRGVVAQLLDQLSADRWEVRHVSEDRTAFHGPDASTTACTAVNVLLCRPPE